MPSGVRISDSTHAARNAETGSIMIPPWIRGWNAGSGGRQADRTRHVHLLARVADRELEELVEGDLGPIAHGAPDLAEIGNSAAHVFERVAVDLFVGDQLEAAGAVAHPRNAAG